MRRTLAVALLLADLRPAAGFQPIRDRPGLTHLLPEHLTIAGPTATALRYANDPHSAADPAGGGASSSALPDTADPLVLLGLDAMAAHDVAAIKAAYRRMTRRHHPDAVLTSASTDGEKRAANDNFARINEAYQNLLSRQKAMGRGYGGEEFGAQTFVDLEVSQLAAELISLVVRDLAKFFEFGFLMFFAFKFRLCLLGCTLFDLGTPACYFRVTCPPSSTFGFCS
jgi:hypothetical protein